MDERPKQRIELSLDDLNTPDVDARVDQMRTANQPQMVQSVGGIGAVHPAPAMASGSWFRSNTASLGLAGLLGGTLGWALAEFITRPESREGETYTDIALWTGLFALGLGILLTSWEGLQLRSWPKAFDAMKRAVPVAVAGGVVGGMVGKKVYSSIVRDAVEEAIRSVGAGGDVDDAIAGLESSVHLARAVGFGLFGLCIGIALGMSSQSKQRMINGAVGGAAGGLLGGFLFDFIDLGSGGASRLLALASTGLVIGIAIGMVEAVRKEFWLEIVSGGMAGKQFIIYHEATSVGSAPDCHVTLIKDPAISPSHMSLTRTPRGVVARATSSQPLSINGLPAIESPLKDGDLLQVGQTMLRFGEKAPSVVMPGPLTR